MGLTTKEISSSSFNDMISSVDRRSEYVENRAGANITLNNFLTPYTLDDKSSILNAPCGYSNGVYPSLRPVENLGPELVAETPNNLNGWIDARSNATLSIVDNNIRATLGAGTSVTIGISSTGFTTVIGKTYKVKIIATKNNSSGSIYARISNNSQITAPVFNEQNLTASISVNSTFVATATTSFIGVLATNQAGGYYVQSSLMSVRELLQPSADFDFTRGSAATRVTKDGLIENVQILSGELVQNGDFEQIGSELITNGDFATDLSGWTTTGTNATNTITWEQGGARIISTDANISIRQLNILTIGKAYKLTCDVNVTTGSLGLDGSIIVGSTINFVNGFNEIYFVATSTTFKIKRTTSVSNCLLDNVSVKEVGQNWSVNNSDANNFVVFNGSTARLKFLNTSPVTQLVTSFIMTAGKKYKLTVDIALVTSGSIKIDGNGISETFNTSGITTRIINPTGSTAIKFYRASADVDITLNSVSLIEITDDTDLPRIDYTDGTGSLLLEPQSTNLQLRSQEFDNPVWNAQRATLTANDAISPDGTLNAYKLTHTSGSSGYVFATIPTVNSGDSRLISVFAKYIDDEVFKIVTFTDSGNAVFNLLNGTVTSATGTTTDAKIENYGNGWYRCSCKYTATTTATRNYGFYLDDTSKEGVHIWGAQVEAENNLGYNGEYATSYIPTEGSTVTRNADVCNNAGSSDLINSTEGVLYAEISALADDETSRCIALSDGSTSNRVNLLFDTSNNAIRSIVVSGSSTQFDQEYVVSSTTNYHKVAIKYKANDFALWINGVERFTDTIGSTPIGLNDLSFNVGNGSLSFFGKVKSVAVFKEALTDEELAKITSTTQQEVFYEMRDRMLQINADYYEFGDYTTRLKKLF